MAMQTTFQESILEMEKKMVQRGISDNEFQRLLQNFCMKHNISIEEVLKAIETEIKTQG